MREDSRKLPVFLQHLAEGLAWLTDCQNPTRQYKTELLLFSLQLVFFVSQKPSLALYQPDIAGNTGTLIRLSAGLATVLHIIEPAGFRTDDTNLKRAGMDYLDLATITRHDDFEAFMAYAKANQQRVILMTTKSNSAYTDFSFLASDIILMGRESSGVPDHVHERVDASLTIRMENSARSLNQAVSAAMVLREALRQTGNF